MPDLPYARTALGKAPSPLTRDRDYDLCHFASSDERETDAGSSRFTECAFENVQFDGIRLRRTKFTDVWWRGSRVLSSDIAESEWLDVAMLSSALAGIDAYSTQLRQRRVPALQAGRGEPARLDPARGRLRDCILRDVDFTTAKLLDVKFPGTALRGAKFAKAKLTRVDFRDATVVEVLDGYQNLRGSIIDSGQAVELSADFAQALGITVKDH